MKLPDTIPEVLKELDLILEETLQDRNYLGVFAFVYKRTTLEIQAKIEEGIFEDNPRLARMDVEFARQYISAYRSFREGRKEEVPACWRYAFEQGARSFSIVQHLLLAMNAHINLDLPISAMLTSEGADIEDLKGDFRKVNEVLGGLTREFGQRIGKTSPLMFLLDWIGARKDEKIVNFSIRMAREQSWRHAVEFAGLQGEAREARIREVDGIVKKISERIAYPPSWGLRFFLRIVWLFETKNPRRVLEKLED